MAKHWIGLVLSTAIGSVSFAGNTQQTTPSSASAPSINPGTVIQVEMTSELDVKRAHAGDVFRVRLWEDVTSGGKVILPRKTLILGHVVDAQARTKTNPDSKLTVAFDKAVLKDGSELPLQAVVKDVQFSAIALAAGAETKAHSYSPGPFPGSTTNIAMPSQAPSPGQDGQLATTGPTNIQDTDILAQGDVSGKLTVLTSATKADVKLKRFATLDLRITR